MKINIIKIHYYNTMSKSELNSKNMEQYFSDDEQENDIEEDKDELVESEDEFDDYNRQLIYEASMRNFERIDNESKQVKDELKKKIKPIKNKSKNSGQILSLDEFAKKVDTEIETKKPKKFVSKRVEDKKKQYMPDTKIVHKRHFNPRYPPYNFVHHSKQPQNTINLNSNEDFPSL